jgi:alanine dehydrogenase
MTVFLDEACLAKLVTMPDALEAVEEVFGELGKTNVVNVPRVRAPLNNGILRITAAVLNYRGYYGIKVSSTSVFGRNAGRLFCLYREEGGELCAIMQVFGLGALRTGAASGVATRYMARQDAHVLGVIGTGRQARTQIEAIASVRAITDVRVFGRDQERRERFCQDINQTIQSASKFHANPVASAEEAVTDCDIVVTATTSSTPVLFGEWLKPGAHVNAIGANYEHRRELDLKAIERASVIATDDIEQVRYESSDLAQAVEKNILSWQSVSSLGDIVAGRLPGRNSEQDITLFKSLGVAMEDVALAIRAYDRAKQQGLGQSLPNLAG